MANTCVIASERSIPLYRPSPPLLSPNTFPLTLPVVARYWALATSERLERQSSVALQAAVLFSNNANTAECVAYNIN